VLMTAAQQPLAQRPELVPTTTYGMIPCEGPILVHPFLLGGEKGAERSGISQPGAKLPAAFSLKTARPLGPGLAPGRPCSPAAILFLLKFARPSGTHFCSACFFQGRDVPPWKPAPAFNDSLRKTPQPRAPSMRRSGHRSHSSKGAPVRGQGLLLHAGCGPAEQRSAAVLLGGGTFRYDWKNFSFIRWSFGPFGATGKGAASRWGDGNLLRSPRVGSASPPVTPRPAYNPAAAAEFCPVCGASELLLFPLLRRWSLRSAATARFSGRHRHAWSAAVGRSGTRGFPPRPQVAGGQGSGLRWKGNVARVGLVL